MFTDTTYSTKIPNNLVQKIGLFWNNPDFKTEDDCDLSCLLINKLGDIDEKVDHFYYNE